MTLKYYNELISRNWVFINKELANAIKDKHLLFAGCGLGSSIATLAARTGFTKFTLSDGDKVEISNFNRQEFNSSHLGINKAEATELIIRSVNPDVEINVIKRYIDLKSIDKIVKNSDYIINTVDINDIFYKLIFKAIENKKIVFIPMNIGFGGLLIVISEETPSLRSFIQNTKVKSELDLIIKLFENNIIKFPTYIIKNANNIISQIRNNKINPQIGVASNITSALTLITLIKIISGVKIKNLTNPVLVDCFEYI